MTFRVNNNVSALNAHRHLYSSNTDLEKSLERLSSGLRINRASDGPAAFAISEHLRSQVIGTKQAISNSEVAVSLLQTTEASMGEVTQLLGGVRQLIIHSLNEGVNNDDTLLANQNEIRTSLETISQIAAESSFGNKKLLDGSNGVVGLTSGNNLAFVGASKNTKDSRDLGFEIKINNVGTRANMAGMTALTDDIVKAGEVLTVIENGRFAMYESDANDTAQNVIQNFQLEIDKKGLDLEVSLDDSGALTIRHRKYGSDYGFQASSSSAGVLGENGDEIINAESGKNIKGSINGESAIGKGQVLTGQDGSKCIDGLSVGYYIKDENEFLEECQVYDKLEENGSAGGDEQELDIPDDGLAVGRVYVSQNSMKFQVGGSLAQTLDVSLSDIKPVSLGRDVNNKSGLKSLMDINVLDYQESQDSLLLVDKAITEITTERGRLGAIQKNSLETNLSNLRVANENLISSESVIRDTDMAQEMAEFTKNQIKMQSSAAMLAHSTQNSKNVLQLLG